MSSQDKTFFNTLTENPVVSWIYRIWLFVVQYLLVPIYLGFFLNEKINLLKWKSDAISKGYSYSGGFYYRISDPNLYVTVVFSIIFFVSVLDLFLRARRKLISNQKSNISMVRNIKVGVLLTANFIVVGVIALSFFVDILERAISIGS